MRLWAELLLKRLAWMCSSDSFIRPGWRFHIKNKKVEWFSLYSLLALARVWLKPTTGPWCALESTLTPIWSLNWLNWELKKNLTGSLWMWCAEGSSIYHSSVLNFLFLIAVPFRNAFFGLFPRGTCEMHPTHLGNIPFSILGFLEFL